MNTSTRHAHAHQRRRLHVHHKADASNRQVVDHFRYLHKRKPESPSIILLTHNTNLCNTCHYLHTTHTLCLGTTREATSPKNICLDCIRCNRSSRRASRLRPLVAAFFFEGLASTDWPRLERGNSPRLEGVDAVVGGAATGAADTTDGELGCMSWLAPGVTVLLHSTSPHTCSSVGNFRVASPWMLDVIRVGLRAKPPPTLPTSRSPGNETSPPKWGADETGAAPVELPVLDESAESVDRPNSRIASDVTPKPMCSEVLDGALDAALRRDARALGSREAAG